MNSKKANLRKLRLPNTDSSGSRSGRGKATATISNFFPTESNETNCIGLPNDVEADKYSQPMPSPIEKPDENVAATKAKRAPRTKLSTFLPKEKRIKPTVEKPISDFLTKVNSDDFETPDKNIKKAPKPKTKPRPKRQQKIKTAFLKNEELFTAVTAQHCLVDNINPDEMQMALALSRSEADAGGVIVLDDDENKEENNAIRDKLKKFGFRVGEPEDYSLTTFMPTKKKTKWANKFTALTLRNANRQLERVNQKVEEFLSTQFISSDATHVDEVWSYSVKSKLLSPLVAGDHTIIRPDPNEGLGVVDFYVLSLFEPSTTRPGYLLKDVRCIAGRDISPKKPNSHLKAELESDPLLQSPAIKKGRYDKHLENVELSLPCQSTNSKSPEILDKPLPGTISCFPNYAESPAKQVEGLPINNSPNGIMVSNDCDSIPHDSTTKVYESSTSQPLSSIEQMSSTRATSPDIFADSDVEMETDDCGAMGELNVSKSSSSGHHITTYEIFSSDEAKTFSGTKNDSNDANHNSVTALIDLTQNGSDTSSQHSDKNVLSLPIQSFQENSYADDRPTTSKAFVSQVEAKASKFSTETFLNGSYSMEKSTASTCFSFGSSVSEEFHKSTSFNKFFPIQADESIDLTQTSDGDEKYIVLSDDEINYSIRKADKSLRFKEEELPQNISIDRLLNGASKNKSQEKHEFSFVDLVMDTQLTASQSEEFDFNVKTKSNTSFDSLDLDLSKRSDFGILDEQSPFKTPTKTPKKTPRKTPTSASPKCRRALSESFLASPVERSVHLRHFSSTKKFDVFTKSDDDSLSDLDDIDKIIYGSPSKNAYKKPAGLDQLLTGAISVEHESPKKTIPESPKEFQFNGRTYLVRTTNVLEKPNYGAMDESALLNELYRYGIKPLKRKQAEKILEYVYNQTHPCLVDEGDSPSQAVTENGDDNNELDDDNEFNIDQEGMTASSDSKFGLKDCWGHAIVSDVDITMEIDDEQYILQTNTSKKVSTALLPFHIAWHNLVKSNKLLHEAILHYEPIDLQEIYLFFKGLGYRYEPKKLKYFFDSRSIIFRYDLNKSDPSAGAGRHVRKKRLKLTQRSGTSKIS